jgi:hypothetical protein
MTEQELFAQIVRTTIMMRNMQTQYSQFRDKKVLTQSIRLEKQVDELLIAAINMLKLDVQNKPSQTQFF